MWKRYRYDPTTIDFFCDGEEKFNEFDLFLRAGWDRALADGLFTFQIDHQIQRRTLDDGDLHYTIELNPSRFDKRRMPLPFDRVDTPFDKEKFNFNRIRDEEILFSLDDQNQTDRQLVIINNSPIRPYHVLLVPDRQLEQPQILNINCLRFGLEFVSSSGHPFIYVGFNSLCGYASINHLHMHGLYMPNQLFIQTLKCAPFHSQSQCYLFDLFPVHGFAFEIQSDDQFNEIAQRICSITNYFTKTDVAHNLSIVKGHSFSSSQPVLRVFLWFRQSNIGAKLFDRCNFACLELSGYMFLRYQNVFDELTEAELGEHLNGIALPIDEREKIKTDVMKILST